MGEVSSDIMEGSSVAHVEIDAAGANVDEEFIFEVKTACTLTWRPHSVKENM
jgi:hypothetical protein